MTRLTCRCDHSLISERDGALVHLLIRLDTDPLPSEPERTPLDVALVLDRSGSMRGGKLEAVKAASAQLLQRLDREDRLALVAYDSEVETLSPLVSARERGRLLRAIDSVETRGMTNLSGGWLAGLGLIDRELDRADQERLRRVLLLTDGCANQGVTATGALTRIGRTHLSQRGIRTTTLGFGSDFNEDLLSSIADESGGNFYFIESPDQAAAAFLEELGELRSVIGQNLEIVVRAEEGVSVVTNYADFPGECGEREVSWRVGDLYADDQRLLLVSLRVTPGATGPFTLAQVGVRYQDVHEGGLERRLEATVEGRRAVHLEAHLADPDAEVLRERLIQGASLAKRRARQLADQQDFDEARQTLRSEVDALQEALRHPARFEQADRELLDLEAKRCRDLAQAMTSGRYGAVTKKQMLMQMMQAKKQRGAYRK